MRRPSRRVAAGACIAASVTVLLTAGLLAAGRPEEPARASAPSSTVTAVTERGDLAQRETVTGALGHGTTTAITGRRSGTLTWLPRPGRTIERGDTLWRVDDVPVVLFVGTLPLYRTLQQSAAPATGRDVDLVASNLRSLGFWHGPTTGARYDRSLAAAVASWQRHLGGRPDGVVRPGDVVVARGSVRVDSVQAHVADSAAGPVLTTTPRSRSIVLKVPADLAASLHDDDPVEVTLPSGDRIVTRVTDVGRTATGGTSTGGSSTGTPSVSVVVQAARQAVLQRSVLGTVTGEIVTRSVRDAVHVPVGALLALSGGGYALERPDHRLLRVEVGLVVDGEAVVTGVAAGVRVLVAS